MRVGEAGERELIRALLRVINRLNVNLMGYDDVSACSLGDGRALVVKTDSFVESADMLPGMLPEHVGRKLVVMNVSDFAAKGVRPLGMLISLAVPEDREVEYLVRLYEGAEEAALEYGFDILGGDTSRGEELVASGFLFGIQSEDKLVRRSGARVGDYVAVTGPFGSTAVAFSILLRGLEAPSERVKEEALKSVYEPHARLGEGVALAEAGLVTASIDSSDGLAASLHELAESSGVGILVESLPMSKCLLEFCEYHGINPVELALYGGGEEYELVVTVPPESWGEACRVVEGVGGHLHLIGRVVEGRGVRIVLGREVVDVERRGWEHFRGWG
ncbi:MAG: thiamine-phosphate kinase [Thermoprotei archaeon]|nr:MAG: thiamine-phosphate kinase [Thermoprotei archaeon]